jgi:hypothetical protein
MRSKRSAVTLLVSDLAVFVVVVVVVVLPLVPQVPPLVEPGETVGKCQ